MPPLPVWVVPSLQLLAQLAAEIAAILAAANGTPTTVQVMQIAAHQKTIAALNELVGIAMA